MIDGGTYGFSKAAAEIAVEQASYLLDLYPEEAQVELEPLRADIASLVASGSPEEVVEDLFRKLLSGRSAAETAGTLPLTSTGWVTQLSVSDGGVPKTAVDSVEVDFRGVTTDKQRNRKFHGHPYQALCLWSDEIIDALQDDGHPIAAGYAGENITTRGIDWADMTMGTRLQIGSVLAQLSSFAVPCGHQAKWFSDGDISRLHHDNGQISRLYATVLEPGTITTGDPITVEP